MATEAARTGVSEWTLPAGGRTARAARRSLRGERRGLRGLLPFMGPAFIAAVAYGDPGNFATNVAGGSQFGYTLLWVVLAANLMAMLVQTLSAKLGIATGMNLPEVCRARFPRRVSRALWVQAELIAMATDLAEFVGAAIGMSLIFGIPLFWAGCITAVASFAILALQRRGLRPLEIGIAILLLVVVAGFALQFLLADASPAGIAHGLFVPGFQGTESVLLATGILGATVMPHVIYLHSALTQHRVTGANATERRRILRFARADVIIGMSIAGAINIAMLVTAAAAFHGGGLTGIDDLDQAYLALGQTIGHHAPFLFGIALLASGLASSSVGTLAGQVVMQGFVDRRIPVFARRAITMAPSLILLAIGLNPSRALVISQVALSFGIPFALVPLVMFTRNRRLMGELVNRRGTTIAAVVVALLIIALNGFLLVQTLGL
jgi:manganese transport protein